MSRTVRTSLSSEMSGRGSRVTPCHTVGVSGVETQGVEGGWVETTYQDAQGLGHVTLMQWREHDTQVELTSIHVIPVARGQGVAHALLEHVCHQADTHGWTLTLHVSSDLDERSMSDDELRSWYARHDWLSAHHQLKREMMRKPRSVGR